MIEEALMAGPLRVALANSIRAVNADILASVRRGPDSPQPSWHLAETRHDGEPWQADEPRPPARSTDTAAKP